MGFRTSDGERGFTMVELLVALAIMAILVAAAAPSFSAFIDRAKVRSAADELVSMVADARGSAVMAGRNVSMAVDGDSDAWCIGANEAGMPAAGEPMTGSSECDCVASPAACTVVGRQAVIDAVEHDDVTVLAVGGEIEIDGKMGHLVALGTTTLATFVSPDPDYQLAVVVAPLGQARACVPAGADPIAGYPSC